LNTQQIAQFRQRRVRVLSDQQEQLISIDDPDTWAAHRTMRRLTTLISALIHAPRPRPADVEGLRDLFRLHPTGVRSKHPIPKVL
jgi:hypothetical protein